MFALVRVAVIVVRERWVIVGQALSFGESHGIMEPDILAVWRTLLAEVSIPAARVSAWQVICTARVTTAQGFSAFRVEGASITSNAADATAQASTPCLRASGRYLVAV